LYRQKATVGRFVIETPQDGRMIGFNQDRSATGRLDDRRTHSRLCARGACGVIPRQYVKEVPMAVRPLRVTMFFQDIEAGWSESHHDMLSTSLTAAISLAKTALIPQRTNLLAAGPWLKYIRASYDDTFRDAQVFFNPPGFSKYGVPPFDNNPQWDNNESADSWNAALLRGISGDLYRRQVYISGIPAYLMTDFNDPFGDAILVGAFLTYKETLVANYGFPVWQRDIQTYPLKSISFIAPSTVYGWVLTVPNHGFSLANGQRIFLSKSKYYGQKFKYNGPYGLAAIIDQNTIALANFNPPVGNVYLAGYAQQQLKGTVPYTDMLLERFTHRKRGRPFDSPRGRQRRGVISRAY
jgi:hypothetical protein